MPGKTGCPEVPVRMRDETPAAARYIQYYPERLELHAFHALGTDYSSTVWLSSYLGTGMQTNFLDLVTKGRSPLT